MIFTSGVSGRGNKIDPIFFYFKSAVPQLLYLMKQLNVVVSPPAFLWDPYLTLTHVIFDLDIRDL